jgi:hypothetical protein
MIHDATGIKSQGRMDLSEQRDGSDQLSMKEEVPCVYKNLRPSIDPD